MLSKPDPSFFGNHPIFILESESLDIIDVNDCAINDYGYDKETFCQMNIRELGEEFERSVLINNEGSDESFSNKKIWLHHTSAGDDKYIQYTSHRFNHAGSPAELAIVHDITEQVEKQETNAEKFPEVQLYRGDRPLAEIVWDGDTEVKIWSQKAEQLFGWTKADTLQDAHFFDKFIYKEELKKAQQVLAKNVRKHNTSYTTQGKIVTKSGAVLISEWYNTLVYDKAGNLATVYSLVQDVSDRKESEYLFKALSEKSLVGVYLVQDELFHYINPRFAEIFGYEKEEIEDTLGPLDLTHPQDRGWVGENLRKRVDGEVDALQFDFRCEKRDGETIHVKVYGTVIEYLGKPAVVGTLLDITHSKKAFERYQASVESFEDLFDSISDAIYIQNKDGEFIKVNKAAVELNGYDREFLIGSTPDVLAAPGKVNEQEVKGYFKAALQGKAQHFEQWGQRKSGEIFPEEVFLKPGTYFGDQVVIAISRDITDRYEVEDEIQKSREKFSQLFKNAPFGIAMLDKHQEIRTLNNAFENIFGYKEAEIRGLDLDQLIVPEAEEENAQIISEEIYKGDAYSTTATRKRKDGSLVEVIISGVPVKVNNRTIAIFGIYVDISERKNAEEKIKQSLKEKEVLLAEIHHRVKNNLAVITGLLELQQYNTDVAEAKDILRESQLRINSIALIHEKLYQNENLSRISMDVYLDELIDIITNSMDTGSTKVNILVDSEPACLTINQAIPCGLILNELITNSYQHAFKGRENGEIVINLEKSEGRISLDFEDDGVGMPEKQAMEDSDSLGVTLIRTLSRQLQGRHSFKNTGHGLKFSLDFKLNE